MLFRNTSAGAVSDICIRTANHLSPTPNPLLTLVTRTRARTPANHIITQRKLPFETLYDAATTVEDGWNAINSMR